MMAKIYSLEDLKKLREDREKSQELQNAQEELDELHEMSEMELGHMRKAFVKYSRMHKITGSMLAKKMADDILESIEELEEVLK